MISWRMSPTKLLITWEELTG